MKRFDRAKLPTPTSSPSPRRIRPVGGANTQTDEAEEEEERSLPVDDLERSVQVIFGQISLGLSGGEEIAVPLQRSFFELGGDSLGALRLLLALRKAHGRAPTVPQLFHAPSVVG